MALLEKLQSPFDESVTMSILRRPLPSWAIKEHPVKKGMSSINSIAVTERLNEAYGVSGWAIDTSIETIERQSGTYKTGNAYEKIMVVAKVRITLANGTYKETYGGNDNADLGDAYKGAVTDALTKIGSWLGIGAHVWKNDTKGTDTDSNSGRGIYELIMAVLKEDIGSEKQRQFVAKKLRSSVFNKSRMELIEKLNSKEVNISDAITKLK